MHPSEIPGTVHANPHSTMCDLALILPPLAAVGYSMLYLLFGGGIGGAIVIFFIAKMFGK